MLQIVVPAREYFNERTGEFVYTKDQTLCLEHSLVSLSKWESKWHKSFLKTFSNSNLKDKEIRDYVRCMTLTQNVDPNVYHSLTQENIKSVFDYINDPMSATTFSDNKGGSRQIITSEVIYSWMVALSIPMECQKWHLNRLLTLIRVCNLSKQDPKKKSSRAVISENASLNELRRKQLNSNG